jgi:glycosyltransferase involved in cell wall biosynthesis
MPRRLPEHSQKLIFLLRDLLPVGWQIAPINNMSEKDVASFLSRSSIFLSFCDQEGCPLPPLEAAFSGNIVVGYTGQGANEYFNLPVLRKVENGNFIEFVKTVLQSITDIDGGLLFSDEVAEQVTCLKNRYSLESARKNLLEFGRRVQQISGAR